MQETINILYFVNYNLLAGSCEWMKEKLCKRQSINDS